VARGQAPREAAIVEAGAVRLRPIVLTAGTTMLGAWPITLDPIFSGLAWSLDLRAVRVHRLHAGGDSEEAPALGRQVSGQTGLRVGRTALRVRNPDHAPDAWERSVLEQWSKLPAATDLTKLESSALVTGPDGAQELRYIKAIPTEALCLACHGEPIEPTLSARIRSLYPTDQATGFRNGELRGALTVRKPMTSTKPGEQP
jgi:hypothetical protein